MDEARGTGELDTAVGAQHPGATIRSFAAISVILSGPALIALNFAAPTPVLHLVAERYGGSAFAAQLMITMPGLGIIAITPLIGAMLDRLGARRVIVASLALYAGAGLSIFVADSLPAMVLGRLVVGMSSGAVSVAVISWLAAAYPPERRSRIIGYQSAVALGAGLVMVPAAGMLGELGGWRLAFLMHASTLLLIPLALWTAPAAARVRREESVADLHVLGPLWPVFAISALLIFAMTSHGLQLPFRFAEAGIVSPAAQGWINSATSVFAVLAALAFGFVRKRLGELATHWLLMLIFALGMLLAAVSATAWHVSSAMCLVSVGIGLGAPHSTLIVLDRVPVTHAGRAAAINSALGNVALIATSAALAPVVAAHGADGAYLAIAVLLVLVTPIGAAVLRGRPTVVPPQTGEDPGAVTG